MILIAPDKFKGSLTAQQVCEAVTEGIRQVNKGTKIITQPLADGGEGTADLLTEFSRGWQQPVNVLDPLFREINSSYGLSSDGSTAFVEMARASGLQLLKPEERNPLLTSTFGTGQLIAHALSQKVKRIILGVGGSATNDGGIGIAEALGYRFLSSGNEQLKPTGENLIRVHTIDTTHAHPGLKSTEITVLSDVVNPLYGKQGAAYIYARQKGATPEAIVALDNGLINLAKVVESQFKVDLRFDGAGAGGGVPAIAKFLFTKARFEPGIDFMIGFTNLEEQVMKASLVITGEGKIDEQSMSGKVVNGVARLCAKHRKPCIAFAGACSLSEDQQRSLGLNQVITLIDKNTDETTAIHAGYSLLIDRVMVTLVSLPGTEQN